MRSRFPDMGIIGRRYGSWTVVSYEGIIDGESQFAAICDCGAMRLSRGYKFKRIRSNPQGCRLCSGSQLTHGHAKTYGQSPTYRCWALAKARVTNKNGKHYFYYGGRGIKMCVGWSSSFVAFLNDMGERPEGKSIDRIDNDGHYSCGHCQECLKNKWPLNCRWADTFEQAANTRKAILFTMNGETLCLSEWGRKLGLLQGTISRRLSTGMSLKDAITKPLRITSRSRNKNPMLSSSRQAVALIRKSRTK